MVNTSWLKISKPGLYVLPAKAHIDPIRAVDTAIITHGHSDHARPGHQHVIATKQTIAIMSARYGENIANQKTALTYNNKFTLQIKNKVYEWGYDNNNILGYYSKNSFIKFKLQENKF